MKSFRKYGRPPFEVVVIHGGPGAQGSMRPVARELAAHWGVLEPLQTAASLEGQVEELGAALHNARSPSSILIGWSWGAMLGFIFAAHHPEMVSKLILVGSAVFEEKYAAQIEERRLNRLGPKQRKDALCLMKALKDPASRDKDGLLRQLGRLFIQTDNLNPMWSDAEAHTVRYSIYQNVWKEAARLRQNLKLLELGKRIECPVVAIHGDYDPHPAEGIRNSLSSVLRDFRFILIKNCGHQPWIENDAKDRFFRILRGEIRATTMIK